MSTRKVIVGLTKRITRASITKVRSIPAAEKLFNSKPENKDVDQTKQVQNFNNESSFHRSEIIAQKEKTDKLLNNGIEEVDVHQIVLKNMEEGRYSIRTLHEPGIVPKTFMEASVAGSNVIINRYRENNSSYSLPEQVGLEMYNAESGEHQKVDKLVQSMLTPSYHVFEENGVVKIRSRSDGTERELKRDKPTLRIPWLEKYVSFTNEALKFWRPNNNSSCEKILLIRSNTLNVVDLETGIFKELETYKYKPLYDFQLNGSLIAFRENYDKPILRVIDGNTGSEVYSRPIPASYEYYLMEDKIAVADIDFTKITWSISDFSGKIIREGSLETKSSSSKTAYVNPYFTIYKNFMIFQQSKILRFVDLTTGKLLTSLLSHNMWINKVNGYDSGKFIISTPHCIQVIDFESPDPDLITNKPVRAVVINYNGTLSMKAGTIGEFENGLSDSTAELQGHRPANSHVVRCTEKERITMVYKTYNSDIVARLMKQIKLWNYDMRHVSSPDVKFDCHGLLYKEVLVDGQWRPVDLSVNEVAELIN